MESHIKEVSDVAPNIGAAYEITVYDTDGKVRQIIKDDAKCYVRNFLRLIVYMYKNSTYSAAFGNVNTGVDSSFRNIAGSLVSARGLNSGGGIGAFLTNAAASVISKGLIVGSGTSIVSEDDFKLGTVITHGTGSGQLMYDEVTYPPPTVAGNTVTISTKRVVSNVSPGVVTISEIGIYAEGGATIMILRDVVPSIFLNPGELVAIVYKMIFNG